MSTGGRSRTSYLVILSRMPLPVLATALIGIARIDAAFGQEVRLFGPAKPSLRP